ncbi:hypothetical protein HY025_01970 [Candidatus Daviesbacteria bacterium]|nr:hypothetical protein [Candidatus Daviesbacteria bacterium]
MLEQSQDTGRLFLPSVTEFYNFALTPSQQVEFQEALRRVHRWHDPVYAYLVSNGVRQTNLGHTNGMLEAASISLDVFPALSRKINRDQLQIMIAQHDVPEFGTKDKNGNDVASSERDTPIGKRRKNLEAPTHFRRVLPNVQDPALRRYLGELYSRFIAQDPDDIDALFTRFMDKFEAGIIFGGQLIFDYEAQLLPVTPAVKNHIEIISLGGMIEPAIKLSHTLSGKAQIEIVELTRAGILRMREIGFPDEAERVLAKFDSQIPAIPRSSNGVSFAVNSIIFAPPQNY